METKYEIQVTTVGELVAESLEREANLMPPSYKEDAEALHKQAEFFRANSKKPIRIWREVASK